MSTRYFRISVGRALGDAAREDPKLAERILAELGRRDPGHSKTTSARVYWTLARAAGRLGTDAAGAALLEAVGKVGRDGSDLQVLWDHLRELSGAMRMGPAADSLLEKARVSVPESPDATGHLRSLFRGDGWYRAATAKAAESRDPAAFRELARMIELAPISADLRPGTLLAAFDLALDTEKDAGPELRSAAEALLHSVVWPFHGDPIQGSSSSTWTSEDGTKSVSESRSRNGAMLGGWPDPFRTAREMRELIRDGTVEVGGSWGGLSVYTPGIREIAVGDTYYEEPGEPPRPSLTFTTRRENGRLHVALTNDGDVPVCVNPFDFRTAVADVVRVESTKEGVTTSWTEVGLDFGRWTGLYRHSPRVDARHVRTLRRGESAEFTYPLPEDLDPKARIAVSLHAGTTVRGPLPAPLVTRIESVVAE